MTERFTKAVEQLGSDKLEIKLGGIYSLERTAHEEKNYHWPVMEVLTSYVRRHAARNPLTEMESGEIAAHPELDIQAILDVIGRRSEDHRTDEEVEYGRIDLSNTDLRGANLQGAYLREANLQGADLEGAYLREANLQGANLEIADLQRAVLEGANLQEAFLVASNLERARLYEANLQGANLQRTYLKNADLLASNLYGANLEGASGINVYQIEWTIGSNETKLGEDLNRLPAWWGKSLEEQERIINEHTGG
jgi:hypothetical protein